MVPVWAWARDLLRAANHIRILGYSLPTADAYIKYLLKSAVIDAPHLKSLDILCHDADGSTRDRYKNFVTFKYCRFLPGRVENYLEEIKNQTISVGKLADGSLGFSQLERAHSNLFESADVL
jgi:hypothetical protein